jgi:hypothetical protein
MNDLLREAEKSRCQGRECWEELQFFHEFALERRTPRNNMSIRGLCLQVMYMEFSFCKKKSSLEGN